MRRGQAMLETALAVLFITFVFLGLFQISHLVTAQVLLDHAAARAARAKAVGFNDFMCEKSARVAMIPVAGRRLWPAENEFSEASLVPIYLESEHPGLANGVLDYERWHHMGINVYSGSGVAPRAAAEVGLALPRFWSRGDDYEDDPIWIGGEARVESHFPFYMDDQGL